MNAVLDAWVFVVPAVVVFALDAADILKCSENSKDSVTDDGPLGVRGSFSSSMLVSAVLVDPVAVTTTTGHCLHCLEHAKLTEQESSTQQSSGRDVLRRTVLSAFPSTNPHICHTCLFRLLVLWPSPSFFSSSAVFSGNTTDTAPA